MNAAFSRQSTIAGIPCALADPSGQPLATGTLHTRYRESGLQWMVVRLDRPGRMIERCLIGSLRQVLLSVASDPPFQVDLDRLSFDPELGRVCVLRGADDVPER